MEEKLSTRHGVAFCMFPFVLVFVERGSHCHFVDQADLELKVIYLLVVLLLGVVSYKFHLGHIGWFPNVARPDF